MVGARTQYCEVQVGSCEEFEAQRPHFHALLNGLEEVVGPLDDLVVVGLEAQDGLDYVFSIDSGRDHWL